MKNADKNPTNRTALLYNAEIHIIEDIARELIENPNLVTIPKENLVTYLLDFVDAYHPGILDYHKKHPTNK